MPSPNIIRGPDGEIIGTPREIPTGLISHYGVYVQRLREYYESQSRRLEACERAREEAQRRPGGARPDLLSFILGWANGLTNQSTGSGSRSPATGREGTDENPTPVGGD